MSQKITGVAFTGGGSGGHTIAALSLADDFKSRGLQNIIYIGSHDGIEKELCANTSYPYYSVSTGKLRRYFSWDNFKDVLKLVRGIFQALGLLGSRRDINCIIATGGYVAVPVVIAGWLLRKKIYLHEQTTRIGLANRICAKFCDKIFVSFEDSKKYLPAKKAIYSGYPLRKEIYHDFLKVENFDGINLLSPSRPILFVTGGGNGAKLINDLVLKHLDDLKSKFIIIHQVGKQFLGQFGAFKDESYHPVAFIGPEMISILKSATLIISRAGAGTVSELMALHKRVIFIPLKIAQKNEQYYNAKEAQKLIPAEVITEDELISRNILKTIENLMGDKTANSKIAAAGKCYDIIWNEIGIVG